MITVTINGKEIKLEKPVTILKAAESAGIKIPTLCYHEQLEKYGGCRLCLVEVEKMPRLQTACTLMISDGMIVRTETEQIADVRRGVLEFLLINHPLDCPYCDKAGECELQDLVEKYGPAKGRFKEKKRKIAESLEDPMIVRNMSRCVMCTRCVRMCEGVQGASAIAVIDRGGHSHIEPFSGGKFDCEYCGNCLSVCPVGALMSRLHRHSYRPWQVKEEYETVCAYCGVGCTVVAQVRDDIIKRVVPRLGSAVNNGMLCSRGRFGYEFVGSSERLTKPLVKKNGILEEASWQEAFGVIAEKLSQIKASSGANAIAGIASPRCTNEDNYMFQKFMRAVIGTNNIDTTARTGYAGAQRFIENIFGSGATANIISDIADSDTVMVIGDDPTTVNPILGLQIRACSRKNGSVLTIGSMEGLKNFNPVMLLPSAQTEVALLEGLVSALKESKGLLGSNARLEAAIKEISVSASEVAEKTGIVEVEFTAFVDCLKNSTTLSLVIGKNIAQSAGGSYKLLLLSAIKYFSNGKIYLLSERANEQGALDMGCTPDMLPGNAPVALSELRAKVASVWQAEIPETVGLNLFEMIGAAEKGDIKALYIMGENALCNIPNSGRVEEAFKKLDVLVVQDIFLTETAKRADVVLPALSWAEKDGTFTNMERRIQRVRKAVKRNGKEDWRIISELADTMGCRLNGNDASGIFSEMASVSPLYKGLSYDDIEKGNNCYPYKREPLHGSHGEIIVEKPAVSAGRAPKLYLKIDKPLFHSGTLSTRAQALMNIYPRAVARMSPETAVQCSLKAGDMVTARTKSGSLTVPVVIDKGLDVSAIRISNNFEGQAAFVLTDYVLDAATNAPCLDTIEITIEKVNA